MSTRTAKRNFFTIPHDTMVIVDSRTPGNRAHVRNETPERLADAIARGAFRGMKSGSSEFIVCRLADAAGFEARHGVQLRSPDDRFQVTLNRHGALVVELCRDDA